MHYLCFYRTSQADSFEQAKKDGALRAYPVDPPSESYGSMRVEAVGDLMDVIDMAVDMMDSQERIEYFLVDESYRILKRSPEDNVG